jgi:hypothetical protein
MLTLFYLFILKMFRINNFNIIFKQTKNSNLHAKCPFSLVKNVNHFFCNKITPKENENKINSNLINNDDKKVDSIISPETTKSSWSFYSIKKVVMKYFKMYMFLYISGLIICYILIEKKFISNPRKYFKYIDQKTGWHMTNRVDNYNPKYLNIGTAFIMNEILDPFRTIIFFLIIMKFKK